MNANFTLIKTGPNKRTKENEEKLSMSLSGKENYFSENSHIMTRAPMRVSFCQVGEYEIIEQLVSRIVAPVRSEVLEVKLIGLKSKEMNTKNNLGAVTAPHIQTSSWNGASRGSQGGREVPRMPAETLNIYCFRTLEINQRLATIRAVFIHDNGWTLAGTESFGSLELAPLSHLPLRLCRPTTGWVNTEET